MATPTTAPVRRWIVRVTIGSFSLAALLGIIALLGGGEFGETEGQILMTTLLVGVVSIAVLCYLATAGRRSQPVGIAGGVTVLVPLVAGLVLIWWDLGGPRDEWIGKTLGAGAVVAATLAQASLLLVLGELASSLVRRLLLGTLGLASVLAAMASVLILGFEPDSEAYVRVLGVVAILDVLGTVVGSALMKFGTASDRPGTPAAVTVPPDLAIAVARNAAETGRSAQEVVAAALHSYLDEAAGSVGTGTAGAGTAGVAV
jgi:hypothetical protein